MSALYYSRVIFSIYNLEVLHTEYNLRVVIIRLYIFELLSRSGAQLSKMARNPSNCFFGEYPGYGVGPIGRSQRE